jgi:ligand-binding sensor domain-containing protein
MNQIHQILKSLILSGFLFFLTFQSDAQQYTFINYSTENGLAQSQVSAMCQDKKGYLWFATYGGLSRFDGLEFQNYSREDGLVANQLYAVFLDSRGEIWIGATGGYSHFDGVNFHSHTLPVKHQAINIVSICEDQKGRIWFGLERGGVAMVVGEEVRFFDDEKMLDLNVRAVFCDSKGRIWAGTRSGLYQYVDDQFKIVSIDGYSDRNVSAIAEDRKGQLWIATYDEGIFVQSPEGKITNYTSENGLINEGIRTIFVDADDHIWFAAKTGVSKFDGKSFTNFSIEQGLLNNNIKFIGQDSEKNIWLGTDGKGILKFAGETFITFTMAEGLSSDHVMSIAEDQNNHLWFATYGNGVCRYDGKEFEVFTDENGLPNNTVWACKVDKNNKVWFGTSDGLACYNGKEFKSWYTGDGLLANKITSLFIDEDGSIWIGNQNGLSIMKNDSFTNYDVDNGLPGGNIRSIHKDKNNIYWLGGSSGLFRFDGKEFRQYLYDKDAADNTVYSIVEDGDNSLWIGTKNGLYLFRDELFIRVSLGESVNANYINFLIADNDRLWVGTNNSIYEFNAVKFSREGITEFKNYSKLEGVRSLESNMNAVFRDSKGNFWFGTDAGLVKYDPKKRKSTTNNVEPFIQITDVKLFFEPVNWKKYGKEVDRNTGLGKDLVVDYNKNHFTFYFTGISHTNPKKVRYEFMLEGFDEGWSPETDARFTTYSNLPHGVYTFKVRACNDSGVWTSVPAEFTFTITPPFWLTWWFYSLVFLVLSSIVVLIYRSRIMVIRRKNEREQLIYKSKLLSLEQQTLNASMNRHFIFNALNSIQYYINKQDKLEANRYLTSFAKLIRKNLDSSVTGNLVSISEELERLDLYLSLENMRFKNKFSYELYIDEEIDTESVKIPPMLLQPYVENSIWHGILPMEKPGTIWIRIISDDENSVRISIRDNGIGINTSMKIKENNGSTHISRGIEITSGRLAVLKKLTNENLRIDGPYELKDEQGNPSGTEVILIIPQAEVFINETFSENQYE